MLFSWGTVVLLVVVLAFAAWWLQVIFHGGNGPGFSWFHFWRDGRVTALIVAVPYALVGALSLGLLYFFRLRALSIPASTVLLPAVGRLAVAYALAVPIGTVLAELYSVADERSFQREVAAMAAADPTKLYSRQRWWPGNANVLLGPNWK